MELQLVTFEQAKALKELGFPQNIYTSKVYLEKTIPHDIIAKECGLSDWQCIGGKLIPCSSDYNKYGVDICSCPTLELAAKWLRETKYIIINVNWYKKECFRPNEYTDILHSFTLKYSSYIDIVIPISGGTVLLGNDYNSYEQALSAGIDKAIEIFKIRKHECKLLF